MKTPNQSGVRGSIFRVLNLVSVAVTLTESLTVVLAASAAMAQTVPVATPTNAIGLITSTGFSLTAEGFIVFTNTSSARNHDREIEAFVDQGESPLRQLAGNDPDAALSYGQSCLDQSGPCFDRPEGDPALAAKALRALQTAERLQPPERTERGRLDLLSSITKAAFWAGDYSIAEDFAGRWLAEARQRCANGASLPPDQQLVRQMDLGDAVHQANSILGEIALSRSDSRRAGECLVASGKVTKASPALGSYGPDLALMRDLLALKQTQPVLEFLDDCARFWETSRAEPAKWKEAILSGKEPDFGAGFKTHFKRLAGTRLIAEATASPSSCAAGEKTTITIVVSDGLRKPIPGAKVQIAAGGGRFLSGPDDPYDPRARLHGPYSASGTSDQEGRFVTWWVVNPAAPAYVMDIRATAESRGEAQTTLQIAIKQ
jgi:hypothetical protein